MLPSLISIWQSHWQKGLLLWPTVYTVVNRQRQQLHHPLKTAVKCALWRNVLSSHWCRVDMRGSVNLVLCVCHIEVGCTVCHADITMIMRIFLICQSILATNSLISATFMLFRYFFIKKHKTRRWYTIRRTDDEENY